MRTRRGYGWWLQAGAVGIVALVGGLLAGTWLSAAPTSAQEQASASETWHEIEVYFSRDPDSYGDFAAVFPVTRQVPDAGVATAALRELIAGPTPDEAAQGYFSELGQMLVGPSSCRDLDFTIRLEAGPGGGTATVQFCRAVASAGIGQDARAQSAVEATLRQFPTIQRVRLLTQDGDCLFDMSGENRCLAAP